MEVDIVAWRCRIGCFSQPVKTKRKNPEYIHIYQNMSVSVLDGTRRGVKPRARNRVRSEGSNRGARGGSISSNTGKKYK